MTMIYYNEFLYTRCRLRRYALRARSFIVQEYSFNLHRIAIEREVTKDNGTTYLRHCGRQADMEIFEEFCIKK